MIALDESLTRREWCYCARPKEFEVSGCPMCGNPDPDWSEYRHHCWCPNCEIDFQPDCDGVFGGPVGVQLCELIGVYFDEFNVQTGELRAGPSGVLHYHEAHTAHAMSRSTE
jgi:hypothetical protein